MADKAPAKKTAAKKAPAKKAAKAEKEPAQKESSKKAAAKKAPAKKEAAKAEPKAAAKKQPAKKETAKKQPAKKEAAKKQPAKKAEPKMKAAAEPEVEEHDHAGHDHNHDHDHEHDEVEEAQALADVERMGDALAALDDEVLRVAIANMSEKSRQDVAVQLQMPRATMYLGDALVPLVRRKLRGAAPEHQLQVAFALAQDANDETIEALGDRAEDPTRDDLLEVLPPVVERHGTPIVTAMLAGYAASDAVCRPVMRELLDTDERFKIGPPIEVEEKASNLFATPAKVDPKELEAKREQRRAAKEAQKLAEKRAKEARATAEAARRSALHKSKRK
jgi:hypothetical protein